MLTFSPNTPDLSDAPGGVAVLDTPPATDSTDPRNIARPLTADDVDVSAFARVVLDVANDIDCDRGPDGRARGRFGPYKVFVAAIRRGLRRTEYRDLSRATVDDLLIRAHRARQLRLARADLVAAMDPDEVRDSEIVVDRGISASFHFVVTDQPRNAVLEQELQVLEAPGTWVDTYLELRHHAEAMRGFFELHPGTPDAERWPRTTGADVVAIAALVDPHIRSLPYDTALALKRRWGTCVDSIGRRGLGVLGTTYCENRALWSCLAAVFVHLASVDAPLPDPATWAVLVAELGHVLALRNVRMTDDGVPYRGAGPVGEAPFKPAFNARTYHELYLEQFKYLSAARGTDRMKPPPGGPGSEQPIPRTTNADVILLSDYWSKQLAKVQEVYGHEAVVKRWKATLADIDHIARKGDPNAAYPKNNVYWRELSNVARQVSVADEAPTKWDYLYQSFKENLAKLPERITDGAKAVGTAASDIAGAIAHGVGKVANEAGKGLFNGFGTPLLIGAGLLGVFLVSRARRKDNEPRRAGEA